MIESLENEFINPSAVYRAAPFWIWNDEITDELIVKQLMELKSHGFGGAFVHPRQGMITEYKSDEWFRLVDVALKTAKELGMKLYLYDENTYPSGFAGGHVSAQLPDCLANSARYQIIDINEPDARKHISGMSLIKAFSCAVHEGVVTILEDVTICPQESWPDIGRYFFIVELEKAETMAWMGGFAYVDLLRPEVTEKFLESTYEAYAGRFGQDFGEAIPAIFTDEPAIATRRINDIASVHSLPFSYWFCYEFEKMNGYSLLDHLPAIFINVDCASFEYPAEKIRYDYYKTAQILWTQNSISMIGTWCERHGIAFTGHYKEHQWPHPVFSCLSPSVQSNYEFHQWPGIDMLQTNILRNRAADPLIIVIKEIQSVANQFRKERTICELYGAGGWDSTFEDYKRIADWIMVNGVSFICQHLTFYSISGSRKRDHPQSFDWREPWWDYYPQMNDYLGRACLMLSSGIMQQRILLLNPSTTGYLVPREEARGNLNKSVDLDDKMNPDMREFMSLLQFLTDRQWDYDLGDEFIMQRHALIKGNRISIVAQSYDAVIISGDMKNMLTSTMKLLKDFASCGGRIICAGKPGPYVDGLRYTAAYEELYKKSFTTSSHEEVHALLKELLGELICSNVEWPTGVSCMRRVLDDGRRIYFFVNHSGNAFESMISLDGRSAEEWNLFTGQKNKVAYERQGNMLTIPLKLEHNQSLLLVINDAMDAKREEEIKSLTDVPARQVDEFTVRDIKIVKALTNVPMKFKSIKCDTPNILTIDYCDLNFGNRTYLDIHTLRAAEVLYKARGYNGNPWDGAVQFKKRTMDRNCFGNGSGFKADYHFAVDDNFMPSYLQVVVEREELCRLLINDHPVDWLKDQYFLDHNNGVADISPYVKPGKNKLTVLVDPFDARYELEAVYIRGDFSVEVKNKKWILTAQKQLGLGSWKEQGYPFYSDAVRYTYEAVIEQLPEVAILSLSDCTSTCITVSVNGRDAELIGVDGPNRLDIAHKLHTGKNVIVFRVCGSLKNLLGPHHSSQKPRGNAWPPLWKEAPVYNQPCPEKYDLIDYGLFTHPELRIRD